LPITVNSVFSITDNLKNNFEVAVSGSGSISAFRCLTWGKNGAKNKKKGERKRENGMFKGKINAK
jgi:hypothetical protein